MQEMSQDVAFLAKDFKDDAETLENQVKAADFWSCSRPCVMMFGAIGAVVVILWIIISNLGGGDNDK